MALARHHVPPWLFGILIFPTGVAAGFGALTVGRLLTLHGLPPDLVGGAVALNILPLAFQFLWAPLIDLRGRRRSWLVGVSIAAGTLLFCATLVPLPTHVGWFIALVLAAEVVSSLASSACGGLMATLLTHDERGATSGWYNAGNLLGMCLFGALSVWILARPYPAWVVGAAAAAMCIVPSLAVLWLDEPRRERRAARELFGAMLRNTWSVLRSRPGWTGVLICLSPAGSAALINLFTTSFADAYHADAGLVAYLIVWGGVITGAGSLIGGYLTRRFRPRPVYLTSAALTALCSLAMVVSPFTRVTYTWGSLSYYLAAGLCYGAYTAIVLEVVGDADAGASTRYTLFTASANAAIVYVTAIDGLGQAYWERHHGKAVGPQGLLVTDALFNLAGIAAMVLLFRLLRPPKTVLVEPAPAT